LKDIPVPPLESLFTPLGLVLEHLDNIHMEDIVAEVFIDHFPAFDSREGKSDLEKDVRANEMKEKWRCVYLTTYHCNKTLIYMLDEVIAGIAFSRGSGVIIDTSECSRLSK
jgi:hypothetical protein